MQHPSRLLCAVFAGLLALPITARAEGGPDPEAIARLVTEIRAHDCLLTPETAAEILSRAAIAEEDAAIALARLVDEQRAVLRPMGGWRLIEPGCPG